MWIIRAVLYKVTEGPKACHITPFSQNIVLKTCSSELSPGIEPRDMTAHQQHHFQTLQDIGDFLSERPSPENNQKKQIHIRERRNWIWIETLGPQSRVECNRMLGSPCTTKTNKTQRATIVVHRRQHPMFES
jgi:hypothetical protein